VRKQPWLRCSNCTPPLFCARLQAENNTLAEALTRQKAEVTVLTQKRARVEQALEAQAKEGKALKVAAQRLQVRGA
jgi:hypothetical protein